MIKSQWTKPKKLRWGIFTKIFSSVKKIQKLAKHGVKKLELNGKNHGEIKSISGFRVGSNLKIRIKLSKWKKTQHDEIFTPPIKTLWKMYELDWILQNMMKFLPLLLNLHNMVKLSLNRLKQDQTGTGIQDDDGIFRKFPTHQQDRFTRCYRI